MPQLANLDPSGFFLPRGPVGCLLIHGFTGSAAEMRPLGDYLAARGVTARAILLPGHGATPAALARATHAQWLEAAGEAYEELRESCAEVHVAGFSMGSLLAVHLGAARSPATLALLSPALHVRQPLLRFSSLLRFLPWSLPKDRDPEHSDLTDPGANGKFWSYDVWPLPAVYEFYRLQLLARAEMALVRAPSLVIYARGDRTIAPRSGPALLQGLGCADKDELVLHNSGHGIVADSESEAVFEATYRWMAAHSAQRGARAAPAMAEAL